MLLLSKKLPEAAPSRPSERVVLAGDGSTSFPPGWAIHHPFRPLQQRQTQLPADPSVPVFIFFLEQTINLYSKHHPHPATAHAVDCWEDRAPSPAQAGGVLPTLLVQTEGKMRASTPARGAGTGMGTWTGRECSWAAPSCTPPRMTRSLSSAGLEPVPLLGEELSRKCAHTD